MNFNGIFGRGALAEASEKAASELGAALERIVPLLAFALTLGYGRWQMCLKNCGSISSDLAVALTLEGFDARVVGRPGHFICSVNLQEGAVEVDLSHLQFRPRHTHTALFEQIWRNPYLIAKVTQIRPYYHDRLEPSVSDAHQVVNQLRVARKALKEFPTFASDADPSAMLAPLRDLA